LRRIAIPAFLARQTDLLSPPAKRAGHQSKKGQFFIAMGHGKRGGESGKHGK